MHSQRFKSFQRITVENTTNYCFKLPEIDLSRDTAVYIRQSHKKADKKNGESRKMQEALRLFAMKLRGQETMDHIRVYDEGAGKSGKLRIDERPELNQLWQDLRSGEIGQIIVAREDRLFRDKHGDQSGAFTRLAEALDVLLFVPPFQTNGELDEYAAVVYYNFRNPEHLKAFKRKMEISADYLSGHVVYMNAAKRNKALRGYYDGRRLPPGLVLERHAPKETRRPVLYQPWQKIMQELFTQAEDLNWSVAALMREIELRPYLFPEPSPEDLVRYEFATSMTHIPGVGYRVTDTSTFLDWFTNVALIGWWTIGGKEAKAVSVLINNHPVVIDEDLFRRAYVFHTGYTLEGEEVSATQPKRKRQYRKKNSDPEALLHGKLTCLSADGVTTEWHNGRARYTAYTYGAGTKMAQKNALSIYADWVDRAVVDRLRSLIDADKFISERVKEYLEQLLVKQTKDKSSLKDQLSEVERKLAVLQRRLTIINRELTGTPEEEVAVTGVLKSIGELAARKRSLEQKLAEGDIKGVQQVQEFYTTLMHFNARWPELPLAAKQALMNILIKKAEIDIRTPHWLEFHIQWLSAVDPRPDVALIWRINGTQVDSALTEQEIAILREVYPTYQARSELLRLLPKRSYGCLKSHAHLLGIRRQPAYKAIADFPAAACWADLQILPDPTQAHELIKRALEQCKQQQLGACALWWTAADAEKIYEAIEQSCMCQELAEETCVFVLPTRTAPARRNCSTTVASSGAT